MRRFIQTQILQLMETVCTGVRQAGNLNLEEAQAVYADCADAIRMIEGSLRDNLPREYYETAYAQTISRLETFIREENGAAFLQEADRFLRRLRIEPHIRLEVVFMPYKACMWDSMESVWRAAAADQRCDALVVPIPYYERKADGSVERLVCERDKFPMEVPTLHFSQYDPKKNQPDIIYIHNPYDDTNLLTSVHPNYYCAQLKKHTENLCYIPYFVSGAQYNNDLEAANAYENFPTGVFKADKVVAQSKNYKHILEMGGVPPEKVAALGSPKIDFILRAKSKEIPLKWKSCLEGRTVFWLNTSVRDLTRKNAVAFVSKIITNILAHKEYGLLWRPHPLYETRIRNEHPEDLPIFLLLKKKVEEADNAVYDCGPDYTEAMLASDALISEHSSIALIYPFTEKPVLHLYGKSANQKNYCSLDYFAAYFRMDGISVLKFCQMVASGNDPMRSERLNRLKHSIANADGTCGERIHQYMMNGIFSPIERGK